MPNLDETELARLGALARAAGAGDYLANDDADDSAKYAAAACNAVPALVAEVRRLREDLNKEHRAWQCAEGRGDGLEMENAALREKAEAWEKEKPHLEETARVLAEQVGKGNLGKIQKALEWAEEEAKKREAVHADRE